MSECMIAVMGEVLVSGHIRICKNGKRILAHRWVWERKNGPIPEGMCVLHQCRKFGAIKDNPACVNIEHLYLGTQQQNVDDSKEAGTLRVPMSDINRAKEFCHAIRDGKICGLPYDKTVTYQWEGHTRTGRRCSTCNNWRAQQRARAAGVKPRRKRGEPFLCGHPYLPDNIRYDKNGSDYCKECLKIYNKSRYQK